MRAVRFAGVSAASSAMGGGASLMGGPNPTGAHLTFAAPGDLIGQFPINATNLNLGASQPLPSVGAGSTTLALAGSVSATDQYGSDQLAFAVSQGEYTDYGATPQTYLQNQFGSAATLLQPYAASQLLYYNISSQDSMLSMSAQMYDVYNYANAFGNYSAGAGNYYGSISYGIPGDLSPVATTGAPTGSIALGSPSDTVTGTPTTGAAQAASGGSVPLSGGHAAVSAAGGIISHDIGSNGQTSSGAPGQPATEGAAVSSFHKDAPPASNGATAGDASLGHHEQVAQSLRSLPVATSSTQALAAEHFTLRHSAADPFGHYNYLNEDNQHSHYTALSGPYVSIGQELTKEKAGFGSDSLTFSDHLANLHGSEAGQVGSHFDPFHHVMQHAADAGGHLA